MADLCRLELLRQEYVMELNFPVGREMTESCNNRGPGVAFNHPQSGEYNVIMIDKVSMAAR